jgi:CcmD family protein
MRAFRVLLLSLFALAAVPALASGAAAQGEGSAPAVEAAGPTIGAAPDAAPAAVAPTRYAPPRTLRAYWHLFVAFAAAWVLLFGYTVWLGLRLRGIERQLEGVGR